MRRGPGDERWRVDRQRHAHRDPRQPGCAQRLPRRHRHRRRMTALLQVSGIEVAYGGVVAVRGLSLTAEPGAVVALLGSNGAGKSSTLRAISGLVQPRAGSIKFDGQELIGMRPEAIERR